MRIAHISDIHASFGNDFNAKVFQKAVKLLNKQGADLVFVSGDVTTDGLVQEYEFAVEKLNELDKKPMVVPGNHDERNLGFKLFPEFFGEQNFVNTFDELLFIGLASSEPDKDDGRLGRGRHGLIERGIKDSDRLAVIGFHHHVVPIPNSGREKNIIEDAGETLDILLKHKIPLVLMGHRHVPYGVRIHNTLLVNAGTFSCNRTRAHFGHTFNVIDIEAGEILVQVVDVEQGKQKKMIRFNPVEQVYVNRYYDIGLKIK